MLKPIKQLMWCHIIRKPIRDQIWSQIWPHVHGDQLSQQVQARIRAELWEYAYTVNPNDGILVVQQNIYQQMLDSVISMVSI